MRRPTAFAFFIIVLLLPSPQAQAEFQQRTVRALEQLAASGSIRALYELGRRYETGVGVELSPEKAFELYCQAAQAEHVGATYSLARLYLTGQGVQADERDAAAWLEKAQAAGHPLAKDLLSELGTITATPDPACERDLPGAITIPAPPEIDRLVRKLAPKHGLDPELVLAVIHTESGFRPKARSPKNALGLMQLTPATAERFGVRNALNPVENLKGGMRYLRWLMAYYCGDMALVLAAYNSGEGTVDQHRGIPPYKETRAYVEKVLALYPRNRHPYETEWASAASRIAQPIQERELASLE